MLEPLEHSVVGLPVEVGTNSRHSVTMLEPIEHSVVEMPNALGKDPGEVVAISEPIEHSALVRRSHDVGDSSVDGVTVSDLIEHSGVRGSAAQPSIGQLMRNSDISRNWEDGRRDCMCDDDMLPYRRSAARTNGGKGHCGGCGWLGGSLVPDRMGWGDGGYD